MFVFEYSELIKNLVVTDLKVKYQNSVLGFAWTMLNPLLLMIVLYLVFSKAFGLTDGKFALQLLVGIIAWRFLAIGTMSGTVSIVGKANLVTKIYIPRQILVLSSVLSNFISSFLEFMVMVPLLFVLGNIPTLSILFVPVIFAIYFIMVYGISLMLSSLYVYYRDVIQIWDVMVQLGFFLTPIVYPISIIPPEYMPYYMLNPATLIIEMTRMVILDSSLPKALDIGVLLVETTFIYMIGSYTFNKLEPKFAEEI